LATIKEIPLSKIEDAPKPPLNETNLVGGNSVKELLSTSVDMRAMMMRRTYLKALDRLEEFLELDVDSIPPEMFDARKGQATLIFDILRHGTIHLPTMNLTQMQIDHRKKELPQVKTITREEMLEASKDLLLGFKQEMEFKERANAKDE
jgi:hypothetical protein